MMSARVVGPTFLHVAKADWADCTADSTSAAVPRAISAHGSVVMGSSVGRYSPLTGAVRLPLIQCR